MLFILQHLQNMLLQLLQSNLRGTNVFFADIHVEGKPAPRPNDHTTK